MNSRQWLKELAASPQKKGMPLLSFPSVELIGTTVQKLIADSHLQALGMKAIADHTFCAASVSMMDLSVEAEAFGAPVSCVDNEVPNVTGAIVGDDAEASALAVPKVGAGRTGLFVNAVKEACGIITDRPVLAGCVGPFSLCGRLIGISDAMVCCIKKPDMVHTVMRKTTDFLIEYSKAFKETGAAGIVMAEPLTGILSPKLAQKFSEPYVKEIVDAVQEDSFIVIYHNCGGTVPKMIDSIMRTGAAGYHFGNAIDIAAAMEKIPSDAVVMGNIDPASQFCLGTPETIREAVLSIMNACCSKYDNFIISSGCDIPAVAKWENINAFFAAIDEYNRR